MNISRSEMGGGPTEADWRELDTTPEFREFVGKKLDQLVSGMIKEKDRCRHLRPVRVEGSVQLFAGAPPLEVIEEAPQEPPPPAKRPKLAGVDLQRYQLKKKSRRERNGVVSEGGKLPDQKPDSAKAADAPTDDAKTASSSTESGTSADGKKGGDASSDSDSDDDDLARFAEAAVPADFMSSLAKSKTVKLSAV